MQYVNTAQTLQNFQETINSWSYDDETDHDELEECPSVGSSSASAFSSSYSSGSKNWRSNDDDNDWAAETAGWVEAKTALNEEDLTYQELLLKIRTQELTDIEEHYAKYW